MPEAGRLRHAQHNAGFCRFLLHTKYNDWKVTSAFYAALHYVRNKIFPINERSFEGKTVVVKSFDEYQRSFNPKHLGKHQLLANLVKKYCPLISKQYSWLFFACIAARYNDHNVPIKTASKAYEFLNKIERVCISKPRSLRHRGA